MIKVDLPAKSVGFKAIWSMLVKCSTNLEKLELTQISRENSFCWKPIGGMPLQLNLTWSTQFISIKMPRPWVLRKRFSFWSLGGSVKPEKSDLSDWAMRTTEDRSKLCVKRNLWRPHCDFNCSKLPCFWLVFTLINICLSCWIVMMAELLETAANQQVLGLL